MFSEVNTKQEEVASPHRSGFFFWSDDVLTESLELTDSVAELVKAEARKDANPWKNIYYHGYLTLWSVKWYLRRQMMDKRWMQNKLH